MYIWVQQKDLKLIKVNKKKKAIQNLFLQIKVCNIVLFTADFKNYVTTVSFISNTHFSII